MNMNEDFYTTQIFAGFRCPGCQCIMTNYRDYMQCENVHCDYYFAQWNYVKFALTPYNKKVKEKA